MPDDYAADLETTGVVSVGGTVEGAGGSAGGSRLSDACAIRLMLTEPVFMVPVHDRALPSRPEATPGAECGRHLRR